ncbi:methyltransferase, putative [Plasmodium gallinaceum]|uniref:tRNA (guanine-N(7)-)-methyltransferase n=1 Tax=Plasmodium gallinaceum TaxID=5849 RepID=A0A1J1GV32_PLAGA|nr:methyltransferase, putative [Plasmodium gallinaceum]CRG96322.1 methyltransferase, putative [Plasmodium gallinaceum]
MKKDKTPCKRYYRQRAHCNPLSDSYIKYPLNYNYVDWKLHYPYYFKNENIIENKEKKNENALKDIEYNNDNDNSKDQTDRNIINKETNKEINDLMGDVNKLYLNTNKHPITYDKIICSKSNNHEVKFLDIGCGYGGLLFALSKLFNDKLILGLEIRDKITNYVGEKIISYRNNHYPYYNNISIIRTNAIKFLPNYIKKNQIEKIFFCFPDPHFKKHNWRRRIITLENLSLYYHLLQKNGLIYFITDVFTLHLWVKYCFYKFPYFKLLSHEEYKDDICIKLIHESSEESKKVKRNNQNMYFCIAKKI